MSDDFWNTSCTSTFNFDDDEDNSKEEKFFTLLNTQKEEPTSLPIHSIISRRNLDLILDDIEIKLNQDLSPPVEEVTKKMFCGRKYVLNYRDLENKINLLDSAIDTMDGNTILIVTICLAKSLNRSLFLQHLSKREIALKHYVFYLIFNNRIQDLLDLYMAAGVTLNMRVACFLSLKNILNKEKLLSRLEQHIENFNYFKDLTSDLIEYKNFTRWQIDKKHNSESVTEQLALLFKNSESELAPFQQLMKVSDFQYEWTQLNTNAANQAWKHLKELYITENWLMKKRSFRSCIRPELFFSNLSRHDPPKELLEEFLTSVSSVEKTLQLAKQIGSHKFVIDQYVSQKDRLALVLYKNNIPIQSQDFSYLENVLQSSVKWKN